METSASLADLLFEQNCQCMIGQAETIRDWRAGPERTEQAEKLVRQALRETGTRINEATRYQVYSILSFVMPADACLIGEQVPEPILEEQAAWEIAYQKQLEQRSCPECGDGVCPVG